MKRKITTLLIFVCIIFLVVGCSNKKVEQDELNESAETKSAEVSTPISPPETTEELVDKILVGNMTQDEIQADIEALVELDRKEYNEQYAELKSQAENYVTKVLKSPSTAVFNEEMQEGDVVQIDDDTFLYSGYVDSQNSYGGMMRSDFTITLSKVDLEGYELYLVDDLVFSN